MTQPSQQLVAIESLLTHPIKDHLENLSRYQSTAALRQSLLYKSLQKEIDQLMNGIEYGFYAESLPYAKKPYYRAVAWNIERGIHLEGIIHTLKVHPEMSKADLLFLTETDVGMARTQNKNVAGEIARALGMNYVFAPSYLNLCKGNSVEGHYEGENLLGLHGNALLSRYPMENLRSVGLKNCKDKMRGREKRIGCQKAIAVEIVLPFRKITAVVAHLDAHSSQRQRAAQMETILKTLKDNRYPLLIGGDLNTSCYNARHVLFAFFGFWNKVFRGVDRIIDEHYSYPDKYFDRFLFKVFKKYGLDYGNFNETGMGTLNYRIQDIKQNFMVQEVVPPWCCRIMEDTLRRHGGKVSLKLDWFAARWLKTASLDLKGASPPKVIPYLKYQGDALSDHDPILVDVDVYG